MKMSSTCCMRISILVGCFAFLSVHAKAQTIVNTETLLLQVEDGVAWTASLSGDFSQGNAQVLDLASDGAIAWRKSNWTLKGAAAWGRLSQGDEVIQASAFGQIRLLYGDVNRLQPFVFVQSSQNNVLKMQLRNLYGMGVKRRLLDGENIDLDLSWVAMYEQENYAAEAAEPNTRLMRNSLIIAMHWQATESLMLRATSFAQTAFQDVQDTRLFVEGGLDVQLSEWLALEWGLAFRWDGQPHSGLNPWDLGNSLGLRLGLN